MATKKEIGSVHGAVGEKTPVEHPNYDGTPISTENISSNNNSVNRKSIRDEEYLELAKDPAKNAAELQEMVDAAAKAAGAYVGNDGQVKKVFHRTSKQFTTFDRNAGLKKR